MQREWWARHGRAGQSGGGLVNVDERRVGLVLHRARVSAESGGRHKGGQRAWQGWRAQQGWRVQRGQLGKCEERQHRVSTSYTDMVGTGGHGK